MKKRLWLWTCLTLMGLYSISVVFSSTNMTRQFRNNETISDNTLQGAAPDTTVVYRLDGYSQRYNTINKLLINYYVPTAVDSAVTLFFEVSLDSFIWILIDSLTVISTDPGTFSTDDAGIWKFYRIRRELAPYVVSDTTRVRLLIKGGN